MFSATTKITITTLCFLLCCWPSYGASKAKSIKQGNALYQEGYFERAVEKFNEALEKNAESDIINFNVGTALYKSGQYDKGMEHLQKALLSEDDQLKQRAHYNLANTMYKSAMAKQENNIDESIVTLEKALPQYQAALDIDPDDDDAKFNKKIVEKKIEELKQKKKQQEQQQQQKKQGQEDNQQQNDQQQNDQQQNDQQQNDQQQNQQQDSQDGQQQQQQNQNQQQDPQQSQDGQQNSEDQQQDNKVQQQPEESSDGQDQQKSSTSEQVMMNARQLTEEEAQRILERYQQTQEPKGLLNFYQGNAKQLPVINDW